MFACPRCAPHSGVDPLLSTDDRLYVYDEGGLLLGEYAVSGTPIQETLWLDDLPIATLRGSTVYPIEPDHLGSPRVVADEDDLLWQWDLLGPVFGEQAPNDTASGSLFRFDLRFPGQQYDAASGLNYNYFRDYEAGVGRYVESDPIGLRKEISTYAYVGANPMMFLDSRGLFRLDGSCLNCAVDSTTIEEQTRMACTLIESKITDKKLLKCIKKRCEDTGKIKCKLETRGFCKSNTLGWALPFGNTANLCLNTQDYPDFYNSPMGIGMVVIHEWAHTCGWDHNELGNVPGSGGSQGPNYSW
ncbi:MAG: hypothetical protein KDI51_03500 [Xanthomonadales bacterium]|nr:hypothetical protein [Xanthomonadales bacterium]